MIFVYIYQIIYSYSILFNKNGKKIQRFFFHLNLFAVFADFDNFFVALRQKISYWGVFSHILLPTTDLGEAALKDYIAKRVIAVSNYIIETGSTVREAAKAFEISKSTVHKDCTERLYDIDRQLYSRVKKVLELNLSQRHLRGGEATRRKYLLKKKR